MNDRCEFRDNYFSPPCKLSVKYTLNNSGMRLCEYHAKAAGLAKLPVRQTDNEPKP